MHITSALIRTLLMPVLLALTACSTARKPAHYSSTIAPTTVHDGSSNGTGRVVEVPNDISLSMAADEPATYAGEEINFKALFEDLGDDAIDWYQHVQTLANPYFEGRVDESAGMERARDYLEFYFELYDLDPAFPDEDSENDAWTSYRQPFEFNTTGRRVSIKESHAEFNGQSLVEDEDFVTLGNSGPGEVSGPITFVGYGIEEGEDGYSSFDDDTALTGRIALLLRYEPLDEEGVSRWAEERFSQHARIAAKMNAVEARGAAGIILVNPPGSRDGRHVLEPLRRSRRFGRPLDIPTMQVSEEAAGRILAAVGDPQQDALLAWQRRADRGEVTTVDLPDHVQVTFGADIEVTDLGRTIPAVNMGATLPGKGALADQWLVIGGHYDHNGYGQFGTTPDKGPLFPGADDNASGVAGILVLAKRFKEAYDEAMEGDNLRSVLFIAFDAEERGLHGSRHYIDHATIVPEKMIALLNMDMIGRLRSDQLRVLGTGTGAGLKDLLHPRFVESGLTVRETPRGSGRSDDANFHRVEVPALHFFTDMHNEYTSPRDKAYTVNPIGAAKVLDLIYRIGMDFARAPKRFAFATPSMVERPAENRAYAPVRLGIRPGMGSELESGVLVDGVSPGTSAEEGGMQAGDVIIAWDDESIDGMQALVAMLRAHQPGDIVTITVLRDAVEVPLLVTLKASEPRDE